MASPSGIPRTTSNQMVDPEPTNGVVAMKSSDANGDVERQIKMSSSFSSARSFEEDPSHIVPTRFEQFIAQRTICAFCLFLALALFGALITGAMFASKNLEFTSQSVWDVRSDPVVQRLHAFMEAKRDSGFVDTGTSLSERRASLTELTLIYKVDGEDGGNIFEERYLRQIAKIESLLLEAAEWQQYCQLVDGSPGEAPRCAGGTSVLDLVRPGAPDGPQLQELQAGFGECPSAAATCEGSANYTVGRTPCTSRAFDAIAAAGSAAAFSPDADFRAELRCLCCAQTPSAAGCANSNCALPGSDEFCGRSVQAHRRSTRILHIGAQMSCNTAASSLARSRYSFGYPLPGFQLTGDLEKDQEQQQEELAKWTGGGLLSALQQAVEEASEATDGGLQVWILGAGAGEKQFSQLIMKDQLFAIGSVLIVFIWIWGGIGSSFLACCGIAEIILAIPLSFAIWGVLQLKLVTGFMLTILFLILGIGADDIFVLWDAFQQAAVFFKDRPNDSEVNRFAWALRRARFAMCVTSATTFCGLAAAGVSQIPSISAFGIFGAFVVLFDFLMVISFFAAAVLIHSRYFAHWRGPRTALSALSGRCRRRPIAVADVKEPSQCEDGLRPLEAFFKKRWSPFVSKHRWAILVAWAIIFVISVAVTLALLRPAKEAPQLFRTDYPQQMMHFQAGKGFIGASSQAKVPVRLVIGINTNDPIDRSGTNYQDPDAFGEPIFDTTAAAALASPEGQLELWKLCEDARNGAVPGGRLNRDQDGCIVEYDEGVRLERGACQTGVTCFIDWVKDYRIYSGNFTNDTWHTENLNVPLNSPGFWDYLDRMKRVRREHGLPDTLPFTDSWFTMSGQQVKWAFVSFNSTLDSELMPLGEILPHFDDWEAFTVSHLSTLSGFQTCQMWSWMATQQELLRSVFSSLAACLLFAWAILCIATANWIVASLSLVCILVILFVFAFFITAMGWSMGIFEAVGLIVVAGLSVDYTVHISHSFNECRYVDGVKADREARTTHALTEMGISVVSGAATTFLASLFLVPTAFTFYHLFGIFMLVTVVLSLLVALTLLPALLCTFGPKDGHGDLPIFRNLGSRLTGLCCSKGVTTEVLTSRGC